MELKCYLPYWRPEGPGEFFQIYRLSIQKCIHSSYLTLKHCRVNSVPAFHHFNCFNVFFQEAICFQLHIFK